MKRSMLATALCGVLMSPLVGAKDLADMSAAEVWELAQAACADLAPKERREQCKSFYADLIAVVDAKQTSRIVAKKAVETLKRYACTTEELSNYGISREECLNHITAKAPDCERLILTKTRLHLEQVFRYVACLAPNRACNDDAMQTDKSWQQHCAELAWDKQG